MRANGHELGCLLLLPSKDARWPLSVFPARGGERFSAAARKLRGKTFCAAKKAADFDNAAGAAAGRTWPGFFLPREATRIFAGSVAGC